MTPLALLRHGPTAWNAARRFQGRADPPLTPETRQALATRRLPDEFVGYRALCSPLRRCVETAAALGLDPALDPRLIEMDWGGYQGLTLAELTARDGVDFRANEARGLDFRPPDGESPRDVQARLAPLLAEIAGRGAPTLAVTHRGVLRALYARAVGWDMTGRPPHALDPYALHLFRLGPGGAPALERINLALVPR